MVSLGEAQDRLVVVLSVAVPCYNESAGLEELYRRVTAACVEQVEQSYEIVLVNDGSTDTTREQIFRMAETDRHVVAIDLARNYGHQTALSAALEFCRGRRVLEISDTLAACEAALANRA